MAQRIMYAFEDVAVKPEKSGLIERLSHLAYEICSCAEDSGSPVGRAQLDHGVHVDVRILFR